MAYKNFWATPIEHTSDATFRAHGLELSTAMTATGFFPKTADTGQIDWATVTRPGTSAVAGYEIRYLNDSLHGTAPIVAKIEWATGTNATTPVMFLTVGTGSNGSGTITGIWKNRTQIGAGSGTPISYVINYPSYITAGPGYFGFVFKMGASATTANAGTIVIKRTTDDTQAINAIGATCHYTSTAGSTINTSMKNFVSGLNLDNAVIPAPPFSLSNTLTSAGSQFFPHVYAMPQVRRCHFTGTVLPTEVPALAKFQATPNGTTPRTYISTGAQIAASQTLAMIWED